MYRTSTEPYPQQTQPCAARRRAAAPHGPSAHPVTKPFATWTASAQRKRRWNVEGGTSRRASCHPARASVVGWCHRVATG
eukprot:scaffold17531_cov241-Isochrysis_galbana.AAC.2